MSTGSSTQKLTGLEVADLGLSSWANLVGGLQTRIRTGDFATGLAVLNAIGAAAEEMNHHPDLDLRYSRLDVRLSSHDAGGITDRDVRLARRIEDIAAAAGVELDRSGQSRFELGLDSPDGAAIAPFWAAVLDVELAGGDGWRDVTDPAGVLPLIWFQSSGSQEPRQRWHPDVWVEADLVQPRIDAAVAAGGRLVSDDRAPRFWVLADAEDNRVCLCTWQERD
ncbi:MAG: 4a-hydroxytetrahydrobiopterin dehydratase [Marmoricola sp.]